MGQLQLLWPLSPAQEQPTRKELLLLTCLDAALVLLLQHSIVFQAIGLQHMQSDVSAAFWQSIK